MKKFRFLPFFLLLLSSLPAAHAQENFPNDLFINAVEVEEYVLLGKQVRFYVEVGNSSDRDLTGGVKIYDENLGRFVASEQAISALSNQTDAVFFDYTLDQKMGNREFNIRVVPSDPTGDNPNNNTRKINIFVDIDSDKDGTPNRKDEDDDNDEAKDGDDAFPLNAKESKDADGDKIGDNEDTDDDNDGINDLQDAFPLDPKENKDSDGDGVGDNSDAFPSDSKEWEDTDGDGVGNNADTHDENKGPLLKLATAENVVPTHTTILFNANGSSDLDGKVVSYEWDFGDGESARGIAVEHSFRKSGEYKVTLKGTDDAGESRLQTLSMTVVHKWQAYALALLAFLLLLLLLFYAWFSRRKRKKMNEEEATLEKIHQVTLNGNGKGQAKSKNKKKLDSPKKAKGN